MACGMRRKPSHSAWLTKRPSCRRRLSPSSGLVSWSWSAPSRRVQSTQRAVAPLAPAVRSFTRVRLLILVRSVTPRAEHATRRRSAGAGGSVLHPGSSADLGPLRHAACKARNAPSLRWRRRLDPSPGAVSWSWSAPSRRVQSTHRAVAPLAPAVRFFTRVRLLILVRSVTPRAGHASRRRSAGAGGSVLHPGSSADLGPLRHAAC